MALASASMIDREVLVEIGSSLAGTAAGGIVGGLLQALILMPGLVALAVAAALWRNGGLRDVAWRRVVAVMCAAVLLALSVEFVSEELSYWYRRALLIVAFSALVSGVLALPIAWWRGRGRTRPRRVAVPGPQARPLARVRVAARRRPGAAVLVAPALLLLASTVPASLLKHRVYPEPLVWSAAEGAGLALVAAPFAWLLGRYGFQRRHGSGFLVLTLAVASSAWLSLGARWQLTHQAAAAMQELASLLRTLGTGQTIEVQNYGRWRYGPYAPMVQGMSTMYKTLQVSLGSLDDMEPVLTKTSFRDAESVRATRTRLGSFHDRIARIDSEAEAAARQLHGEIERASIPSDMRRKMLEGIDRGLGGSPVRLTGGLAPMVQALDELVSFMESRQGRYRYEGGRLLFDRDADAARYNRLVDNVRTQRSLASAVAAQKKARARDATESFGRWARDPFNLPRPGAR